MIFSEVPSPPHLFRDPELDQVVPPGLPAPPTLSYSTVPVPLLTTLSTVPLLTTHSTHLLTGSSKVTKSVVVVVVLLTAMPVPSLSSTAQKHHNQHNHLLHIPHTQRLDLLVVL